MKSSLEMTKENLGKVSQEFWIYLAGMIDGDGSIMINTHKDHKAKRGYCWEINVKVSNTQKVFLEALKKTVGGSVSRCGPSQYGIRPVYQWKIGGNTARVTLDRIYPYLIIKKKQCMWAMQALEITIGHRRKGYDQVKSDKCLNMLRLKVKTFNRKDL